MTFKEASKLINEFSFTYKGKLILRKTMNECISRETLIEFYEVVCKALEKQIPKNLNTETVNHGISVSGEYDIDFNYLCPTCGAVVGDYETDDVFYKFCPDCGQALNWSEFEIGE